MKRIFTVLGILLTGVIIFLWLRAAQRAATGTIALLDAQELQWQLRLTEAEAEQRQVRPPTVKRFEHQPASTPISFSPALAEWLAAGKFSEIPPRLVPELRRELALADDTGSDYVFISKPTMETLEPRSPGKNDKLSDPLCALLSLTPEQRTRIEAGLAAARGEFSDWARQNVVRDGPADDALVRYTLPAASDFADAVTNRLMSTIADSIGAQRTGLFRTYAETWFQIEMGYLGGVTNTLAVLNRTDQTGQPGLFYKLSREGVNSSMSEGPAEIHQGHFPPAWRNVFPGGWAEVAEREGFSLPTEGKPVAK